ncbi:MAG: polyprenyl synthetase family protein, partial [Sphingobacteriaceae bacterium]
IRRGQASCHVKFGESTALLAGNALLTLAFEVLANRKTNADGAVRCELITQFAKAIGVGGMISGQILDLLYKNDEYNINDIIRTQKMKTGALFAVACESGAIIAKAPKNIHTALKGYAHAIGIAYQIIDDIADHDDNKKQSSFVSIMGIDKAFDQASKLIDQALIHLNIFDHVRD